MREIQAALMSWKSGASASEKGCITSPMPSDAELDSVILRLTSERGAEKSICPSEAARALAEDWRPLMGPVRAAAVRLAEAGRIEILRKGRVVEDPRALRGVIRLRVRGAPR